MPDDWEKKNGLNPKDPSDASGYKLDKYYTNIEVYLDSLVKYLVMKAKSFVTVFFSMAFAFQPKKNIKVFIAGDSTVANKEVKAFPETGWGMPFAYFFDSTVTVDNRAKNGRSTKSFISEGLWQKLIDDVHEGDYVFIQFGHNDEVKEKTDRYTPPRNTKPILSVSSRIQEIKKLILY